MGKIQPQELTWHGKSYTFTPGIQKFHEDTRNDVFMPICGGDTESVKVESEEGDYYEPQCVTWSTPWGGEGLAWVGSSEFAFFKLLEGLLLDLPDCFFHKTELFVYVHNLGYDVPQFFKSRHDLMTFARAGVYTHGKIFQEKQKQKSNTPQGSYFMGRCAGREIYLLDQALFIGTAPHFSVRAQKKRGDYVTVTFLDSGSFFRGALSKVAEQLKLPVEKDERQEDLGRKDFRSVPDEDPDKQYFVRYAKKDATVVRMVGEKIVDLHKEAGFTKIRKSAPGFANAYFKRFIPEGEVIYSGSLDKNINQLMLDSYAGGRTGGIVHGRVSDLSVYDFASSYPTAMTSLPSFTGKMKYFRLKGRDLEWSEVWSTLMDYPHAFLRVDGNEADAKYPSLIQEKEGRLTPVYGAFTGIATTGPEVIGGVLSGSLTISRVREAVFCVDVEPVESPFRLFAEEAYKMKQREQKDTIPYLMAKLLLNSAYGKWIQSTKAQFVGEDASGYVCAVPVDYEPEYASLYMEAYAKAHAEGLDPWEELDKIQEVAVTHAEMDQITIRSIPFDRLDLSEKEFAPSAIPGAASLITGIARARLRALMKCTGALYWDTDSVFIRDVSRETFEKMLDLGNQWVHKDLKPLGLGSELGNIDKELDKGKGWLAGTKRYWLLDHKYKESNAETVKDFAAKIKMDLSLICELNGLEAEDPLYIGQMLRVPKLKQATHGLTALKKVEARAAIEALATGKNHRYQTKERPLKAKEAKDKQVGMFVSQAVEAKFNLDPRILWQKHGNYFEGVMKEWKDISGFNSLSK